MSVTTLANLTAMLKSIPAQPVLGAEATARLLETLGEYVISLMLDEFGAPWVKISIAKIGIMKGVRRVGVQIERAKT